MTALDPQINRSQRAARCREPVSDTCSRASAAGAKGDDAHRRSREGRTAPPCPRARSRQREQLRQCFDARLTDVAANAAAQAWQDEYEAAVEPLRQAMLGVLAEVAARDAAGGRQRVGLVAGAVQRTHPLLQALCRAAWAAWQQCLRAAFPDPVARGHAALAQAHSGLRELDEDLEALFSNWFDVGCSNCSRSRGTRRVAARKADPLRGRARDLVVDRPAQPARFRSPLLRVLPPAFRANR
jgi:malonyl-CoA decarboxylase